MRLHRVARAWASRVVHLRWRLPELLPGRLVATGSPGGIRRVRSPTTVRADAVIAQADARPGRAAGSRSGPCVRPGPRVSRPTFRRRGTSGTPRCRNGARHRSDAAIRGWRCDSQPSRQAAVEIPPPELDAASRCRLPLQVHALHVGGHEDASIGIVQVERAVGPVRTRVQPWTLPGRSTRRGVRDLGTAAEHVLADRTEHGADTVTSADTIQRDQNGPATVRRSRAGESATWRETCEVGGVW